MEKLLNQSAEDIETNHLCLSIFINEALIHSKKKELKLNIEEFLERQKREKDEYVQKNGKVPVYDDDPQYFLTFFFFQNNFILDKKRIDELELEVIEFKEKLGGKSWVICESLMV